DYQGGVVNFMKFGVRFHLLVLQGNRDRGGFAAIVEKVIVVKAAVGCEYNLIG
nr:hypothetical protein [Tanacetum cinerariifolium]